MNKNPKSTSKNIFDPLLYSSFVIFLVLGLFYWNNDLYMTFWLRRFFIGSAGVVSALILFKNHRLLLMNVLKARQLPIFLLLSTVFLLLASHPADALFGRPLMHPSLVSLWSSIAIGLLLSTFKIKSLAKWSYLIIVCWSVINFVFWITGDLNTRLGFIDSQVIYASFLFVVGIILGIWLYEHKVLPKKYLLASGAFLLICLLLSQTRSAILILFLIVLFKKRSDILSRRKLALGFMGIIISIILIGGVHFSRLLTPSYMFESINYRTSLSRASLPDDQNKLIFGGGIGSIEWNIFTNGGGYSDLANDIKRGIQFESSHNYLVDILVERGLVVTILFALILVSAFRKNKELQTVDRDYARIILLFITFYLLVNNINIHMEVILWSGILILMYAELDKKKQIN